MPNENEELQKKIDDGVRERLASFTREDFQELRKNNPAVRSIVDSEVNKGANTGFETFKENEVPKLKEQWQSEAGIDAREKLVERKLEAMKLATDRNLDVETAFSLLGLDDDATDESRLDAVADIKQAARNEFLKANGRQPHISLRTETGLYDRLDKLPPDQLAKVSPGLIDQAGEEMLKKGKKSRGQSLREELFGGKK